MTTFWILVILLNSNNVGIIPGYQTQAECIKQGDAVKFKGSQTLQRIEYVCLSQVVGTK
jgi:hypothetical protein